MELLKKTPEIIDFSKWDTYLPVHYQAALLKEKYFDFEGCYTYLENLKFVENQFG